ncbi:MAG: GAF domain-containing sensor histidine kinase [Methanomicrobiales archaeon]|nr:GAF domain-containing sensor histidine kinase [Methanomicrobiales archaeon]
MLTALKEAEKAIKTQNHQLAVINEIISIVSRADKLDGVFDVLLRKTIDMLGFDTGAIFLLNLQTKQAELKGHAGIPSEKVPELSAARVLDIHLYPHEQVFTRAVPVYYEDSSGTISEPGKIPILVLLGIHSLAVIPLSAGSVVLGAMYIGRTEPHQFSKYERGIITSIGKEIGNALFKGVLQDKLVAAMTRAEINHEQAQKAKDEANFYLDIITHDINNVNQTALGYIQLLSDPLEATQKELVKKLENTINKSSDIIHQVSIIRRIREKKVSRKEIQLDAVIRDTIHHFSDAHITYYGLPVAVSADELIPEIFLNLIGNSLKFSGPDADITIAVEEKGEEVEVTVQDTGPGIPDALKPVLFQKFQRGSTSKSGKGLGLYIVRVLVERYGGRVWIEDAIPGHPESGAAIKFTLRRFL